MLMLDSTTQTHDLRLLTNGAIEPLIIALTVLDKLLTEALAAQAASSHKQNSPSFARLAISVEEALATLSSDNDGANGSDTTWALQLALAARTMPQLAQIADRCGLTDLDAALLLIALAPELDSRYERVYGYLQDDLSRRRPTLGLALRLLCPSLAERFMALNRLDETAPLRRWQLIRLLDDPADHAPPLPTKYLAPAQRLVSYLLGNRGVDPALAALAQQIVPKHDLADLILPAGIGHQLRTLVQSTDRPSTQVLYLQGSPGAGRKAIAEALCKSRGTNLLLVHAVRLAQRASNDEALLAQLAREAVLLGAALYLEDADQLLAPEHQSLLDALLAWITELPGLHFLAGSGSWLPMHASPEPAITFLRIDSPDFDERRAHWRLALEIAGDLLAEADLAALAGAFRFSPAQIRSVVANARSAIGWREPGSQQLRAADLFAAARQHSGQALGSLARKIEPRAGWNDLVLPADQLRQLREICAQVTHRAQVYDTWGFARRLSNGRGLNVLFAGPSGTGKTLAAEIIAGVLGLDLYAIDLASVVSKYIGETEKNLGRLFDAAERSNAVLFFDEADALFGKRSEVRDAHDRYANIEVAYLLQRIETYEGIVILATNLSRNMDDAFVRRLQITIEFPLPDPADRLRIWKTILPSELPLTDDVDLDFLARRFELTGGHIRNIALAAAFLAAADGEVVGMQQLIQATRREYQKMGKIMGESEFGPYSDYVKAG